MISSSAATVPYDLRYEVAAHSNIGDSPRPHNFQYSPVSSGHYATAAATAPAGVVAASARSNWRAASSQL